MDERGMEVRGSKVGPVLEGSTLILTCDIIGGKEKIKSSFFISHTYIHFFSSSFLANLWQMYIYLFLLFPLSDLIWKYIRVSNFTKLLLKNNVFKDLLLIRHKFTTISSNEILTRNVVLRNFSEKKYAKRYENGLFANHNFSIKPNS